MSARNLNEALDALEALVASSPPQAIANGCGASDICPQAAAAVRESDDQPAAVPEGTTLGYDSLDAMAFITLAPDIAAWAEAEGKQLATALASGGATCAVAKRMIARDVSLAHARLRTMQGLQGQALSGWSKYPNAPARAEALGRLIAIEHRQLLASLETLRRMDRTPPSAVRIARAVIAVNR